jgi:hypothetical protein
MKKIIPAMIALCALAAAPALAQQTAGNISGRILDAQGAPFRRHRDGAKPSDRIRPHGCSDVRAFTA